MPEASPEPYAFHLLGELKIVRGDEPVSPPPQRTRGLLAALPLAQRLVREEPFDEGFLRALMRAHTALGQRGAALAAYERFVGTAADELGIEPDEATRSLARSIRTTAHPALSPAAPLFEHVSPEAVLERARAALERADRATLQVCLERLRAVPGGRAHHPSRGDRPGPPDRGL